MSCGPWTSSDIGCLDPSSRDAQRGASQGPKQGQAPSELVTQGLVLSAALRHLPSEAALGTASSAALPPAPAQASADPARAAQGGFTPAAQASAATDPAGRAPEARPEAAPATQAPAELLQLVPQQAPAEMSDDGFDTERAQLQAQLEQRQGRSQRDK